MSITHFSPYCSIHACMGLGSPSSSSVQRAPLSYISLMVPNSLSHCFLRKKKIAQSWSNTDCTIYPQRFDLALLKGNLFLWTRFPCQFSLFSPGLLRFINYYCISLCILGKLRFPSRPLISLLASGLQQLWESRERGHGISFCWRDRGVDLLLEREINYNANSKRWLWSQGFVGEAMHSPRSFLPSTSGQRGMREASNLVLAAWQL